MDEHSCTGCRQLPGNVSLRCPYHFAKKIAETREAAKFRTTKGKDPMQPKYTYEQLIEKITRAKVALENAEHYSHASSCNVSYDPEPGMCTCGADARNGTAHRVTQAALKELEL